MIVIDPGHGGADPGAVGPFFEKDKNFQISNYQLKRFQELGVPVQMTRYDDETLTPSVRVERILNAYGNNPAVVVLSNHVNAGGGQGAEVIYALRNSDELSRKIATELQNSGQNVRSIYQRRSTTNPSRDYYFIHRQTGLTEPVLVEYGFLDNTVDVQKLENDWESYAEAVVKAVTEYKGFEYTPPTGSGIGTGNGSGSNTGDITPTFSYTVQAGDSLYAIARRFDTTVADLKTINNLTSDLLLIGQILNVPTQVTQYIVQQGDSLYAIARRYNSTVSKIKSANNLTSNTIFPGQKLLIPLQN